MQSTLLGPHLAVIAAEGDSLPDPVGGIQFYSSFPGSMTRTLVCENVGAAPIPALVAYVSGLYANRFSIVSPLAGSGLAPGASDAMSLRFQPSSPITTNVSLRFGSSTLSTVIREYTVTGSVIAAMNFWNWENFGTLAQTETNAPTADPDGDGLINLLEYAFNLEPLIADFSYVSPLGGSGLPLVRLVEEAGTRELRVEYIRRRATSNPGISYIAEFSTNLSNDATQGWKTATAIPMVTPLDDTWERVVVRDVSVAGGSARYGRVRIVVNP